MSSGFFDLKNDPSHLFHILPTPWDATCSYQKGTSKGPRAIKEASTQLDLWDSAFGSLEPLGFFTYPIPYWIETLNQQANTIYHELLSQADPTSSQMQIKKLDHWSLEIQNFVFQNIHAILKKNKIPLLLGGEHSVSLGAFRAVETALQEPFGILHIDAHLDLRERYQGLQFSHASVFFETWKQVPSLKQIVSVAIRDFCQEEWARVKKLENKHCVFLDRFLWKQKQKNLSFESICKTLLATLPQKVWISLDIDGLDPSLCPHTGTPVPGGLSFYETISLLETLALSKKTILGADLVEVAPGHSSQWDANIGMRLLYQLAGWIAISQKKTTLLK